MATTHLTYIHEWKPDVIPQFQVKNLMHHINRIVPAGAPIILGGDFNCDIDSSNMDDLNREMHCLTRKGPPTWPVDHTQPGLKQRVRLDHIFTRAANGRHTGTHVYEDLSDHAVVIAEVTLPRRHRGAQDPKPAAQIK